MTTHLIFLTVNSKKIRKLDKEFFEPRGSLLILKNNRDSLIVQFFLHPRQFQFHSICLTDQFCQTMSAHGDCGTCSAYGGLEKSLPLFCSIMQTLRSMHKLKVRFLSRCLITIDALITPSGCSTSKTPCLTAVASFPLTLSFKCRCISMAQQNIGYDPSMSFTCAF